MTGEAILFLAVGGVALAAAVAMVLTRNMVYSALYMVLVFLATAIIYLIYLAPLIAFLQITVYAGGIMVLFLFVIMFLNIKKTGGDNTIKTSTLSKFAGAIAGGLLFIVLVSALKDAAVVGYNPDTYDSQVGMVENLGYVLFTDYLLPFELASVLFLVAMVGAVMIGKKEEGESHF